MAKHDVRASKFLSLVLRHRPEKIGITLDAAGWTPVDMLLVALARHKRAMSVEALEHLVENNDKQRFAFNEDRSLIRANQGHSVAVELGYEPSEPPDFLYHGTVDRFLPSIRESGLAPGGRHHVHLSPDRQTAEAVGARRGKAVILVIDSAAMFRDGHAFQCSANGVWLAEAVTPRYIVEGL